MMTDVFTRDSLVALASLTRILSEYDRIRREWVHSACDYSAATSRFLALPCNTECIPLIIMGIGIPLFSTYAMQFGLTTTLATLLAFLRYSPVWTGILLLLGSRLSPYLETTGCHLLTNNPTLLLFFLLLIHRTLQPCVHAFSYYFSTFRSTLRPLHSHPREVTIIIPTCSPSGDANFSYVLTTLLDTCPSRILIATTSASEYDCVRALARELHPEKIIAVPVPANISERERFLELAIRVNTPFTAWVSQNIYWSQTVLRSALAEFEDYRVGFVAVAQRSLRRSNKGLTWAEDLNDFLACAASNKRTFDGVATFGVDGGVVSNSAHTGLARTLILHTPRFRAGFLEDEHLRKIEDDNFMPRAMTAYGFTSAFHSQKEGTADILQERKSWRQLIMDSRAERKTRETSKRASLFFDRDIWARHPWTAYSAFMAGHSCGLGSDVSLFALLHWSGHSNWKTSLQLMCVMMTVRVVPIMRSILQAPRDVFWLFFIIEFEFLLELFRLWIWLTG